MFGKQIVQGAALIGLASCNTILGIGDFRGPADGDGGVDLDAPDGPPAAPALRSPEMGATTGSAHASKSLRPTLSWRPAVGATRYELSVDDSCPTASFQTCLFPSPELEETNLATTTFTPSADLAVAMSVPVGRRYFWRVRACNDDGCSDWSEVWYLDVGRLGDDINGDGYADLVVGIESAAGSAAEVGAAYLAFGRPDSGAVSTTRLDDPSNAIDGRFGSVVAMVGDVNADGYGDVAVGSWKKSEGARTGVAYLYLGRGTWPATVAAESTRLVLALDAPATAYGGAIAGGHDVNGDGYGDIAVGAVPPPLGDEPTTAGYVYVHFGRATWPFSVVGAELVVPDPAGEAAGGFGIGLGLGDLDQDGRADTLVGAPYASSFLGGAAAFFTPSQISTTPFTLGTPSVSIPSPVTTGMVAFGWSLTTCNVPDAAPTLVIGAPLDSMPTASSGVVRLYGGMDAWPATVTDALRTLPEPAGAFQGRMGWATRCGDVNGDGDPDLIVGAPTGDDAGAVYVYSAVGKLPTQPLATLTPGGTSGTLGYGLAVTDFNGDGVPDVFAAAPNLVSQAGRVLGWLGRAQWPTSSSTPDITIDNPSGVPGEKLGWTLD